MTKEAKQVIASAAVKQNERELDLQNLQVLAIKIEKLKSELAVAVDARRRIWVRRLKSGDTTKATLARASRCTSMNITQGTKDELVKKMKR